MSKNDSQAIATWIFGSLTFILLIYILLFAPEQLSAYKHNLIGFFTALLAGFFTFFLTGNVDIDGSPKFPFIGSFQIRAAGGVAIFILVLLWWKSDFSPVTSKRKFSIIPIVKNTDIHLGDNVYPYRWGYNHNPLHNDIYPQNVKGLIYFDKKDTTFFAGEGRQTRIAQAVVNYLQEQIRDIDFSGYKYVSAYQNETEIPDDLKNILNKNDKARFVKLDPATILYTNNDDNGNFYNQYSAVALIKSVDLSIPLASDGLSFQVDNIEKCEVYVECYHGGINLGQDNNFMLIINDDIYDVITTTSNSREKEVVKIDIRPEDLNYKYENVFGFFVLPWTEEKPLSTKTNLGPSHFRDIGIVNAYIKITGP